MNIDQEKMIVEALPSLYPLKNFEEEAIHAVLDAIPKWIPVTERLPGIGEPVLDDCFSLNWMSYRSGGKEWVFPRDVRAWMPLPEAYKKNSEGATE